MQNSEQRKTWYSVDLEQRKTWYSPVADAYNKLRPRYPQELVNRVVEIAHLPEEAAILEIGCGPGNATVSFAQLGYSMVCLEPSPEACQLARQNCAAYPNVEFQQSTFEEWELETGKFNAVLAATSFHWVSPDVGYAKVANTLQDDGSLILLWNMTLQPQYEVFQTLNEAYEIHAPSLVEYEDRETQANILKGLGQKIIDSGKFKDLVSEYIPCEVTYSVDNYLLLLSTFSPYIGLNPQTRDALFALLREKIEQNFGGSIKVSYLSAFHVAQKF
ncbi:hypothetical protein NIES4074_09230 [Cylindrospermum sp. NIES-4074]|nr:hypothetical protein NIES4074_09230 [Cylindrospermum sp. NIES-4074]